MTACMLRLKRVLSILLITNQQSGSRIARIDVTLDGQVVSPEKVLRTSSNAVVAVAPGSILHPATVSPSKRSRAGRTTTRWCAFP